MSRKAQAKARSNAPSAGVKSSDEKPTTTGESPPSGTQIASTTAVEQEVVILAGRANSPRKRKVKEEIDNTNPEPRGKRQRKPTKEIKSDEPAAAVKTEEPAADLKTEEPPKDLQTAAPRDIKTADPPKDVKIEEPSADTKVKRKRKTKEEKEAEAMPLAPRTVGHKLFIGAHVSASGGVHKAVLNSVHIGANAFALFLKSQRKWANPPLVDEVATAFHAHCKTHTYDATSHVVPHGSYLVNLAHTDKERTKQAYEAFLDDLQRCERLGIKLYNFHPGNSVGNDRAAAIKHLAGNINRAHKETKSVVMLLENMAAGGNIIGTTFEDLRDTIHHVEDKDRVGVCLDTCHAFAAGYDLRTPDAFKATLQQFDEVVGIKYLKALHLNDSKAPFSAHRDLHANIGTGYLGLRAFHNIVNEPRFAGLPLVLETPTITTDDDGEPLKDDKGKEKEDPSTWAREIKLLESLVGMDPQCEEFLTLEQALSRKGEKERRRVGDQAERRKEKEAKKAAKGLKKKSKDQDSDSSLSELD